MATQCTEKEKQEMRDRIKALEKEIERRKAVNIWSEQQCDFDSFSGENYEDVDDWIYHCMSVFSDCDLLLTSEKVEFVLYHLGGEAKAEVRLHEHYMDFQDERDIFQILSKAFGGSYFFERENVPVQSPVPQVDEMVAEESPFIDACCEIERPECPELQTIQNCEHSENSVVNETDNPPKYGTPNISPVNVQYGSPQSPQKSPRPSVLCFVCQSPFHKKLQCPEYQQRRQGHRYHQQQQYSNQQPQGFLPQQQQYQYQQQWQNSWRQQHGPSPYYCNNQYGNGMALQVIFLFAGFVLLFGLFGALFGAAQFPQWC